MFYSIDKIEDNIVLLENIDNKEKIEVDKKLFTNDIKEGSIIKYENNNYTIDKDFEKNRREKLEEKLKKVKS